MRTLTSKRDGIKDTYLVFNHLDLGPPGLNHAKSSEVGNEDHSSLAEDKEEVGVEALPILYPCPCDTSIVGVPWGGVSGEMAPGVAAT